ncbi:acireductone synthase [Oleiagrimonas soli]|uniref:Enolase-phosphatase E1 n=1 Tax=Oleiagrimonas soli TaxID=1543381 RepID=A0A099CY56_9GAMM|nr:acireductone synthase [Oleiagrimonas soli]KGI77965.1 haloacid dehalogenase [Oleiagrimonas soli]MBB6183659.1 enolase-phosphatase E1 [Oleiagrimonas soli]
MSAIRAIVTDIEGTTSSIRFVHEVLFPYARKRLPAFVETHADKPEVQHWLSEAAREAGFIEASRNEVIDLLIGWIDSDRKATSLKALQGLIWAEGYASGDYLGHVYPEVADRLRAWHAAGIRLYVYSSGSVEAQKLLFGHSEAGDLTPLFSGYFDTRTGPKRETASYARILEVLDEPGDQVLFLSDVVAELDAARAAGMRTTQLCRPPETCPTPATHPCVADFDAVEA